MLLENYNGEKLMKILIINAVYKIKSTGRTYYELSEYARKSGHECVTVYGNELENYKYTYYMGNKIDHKLHALKARFLPNDCAKITTVLRSYLLPPISSLQEKAMKWMHSTI